MEDNIKVNFKEELKKYADIIIADGSSFIEIKNATDALHRLFVQAGGINAYHDSGPGTFSPTGNAVSPEAAARCLLDFARTRKFARGLLQALKFKTAQSDETIKVLYAGSGPYALLALLMTPYFTPGEVQFTAIDIHAASVDSAGKISGQFGAAAYFANIKLADAVKYKAAENEKPDVLIAEAMLNALRKEQQVSIVANLAPQLAPGGIMIPEEITVTPVFTEVYIRDAAMRGEDAGQFTQPASFLFEPAAVLNTATAATAAENIKEPFKPVTILPNEAFLLPNYVLELQTTITVWGNETLSLFDSGITLPQKVAEGDKLYGKEKIIFTYKNGPVPGFEWDIK